MLSTGVLFMALSLPQAYDEIYSVETWYSRGVRGERSDVVTFYEPTTLMASGEVRIPNKRGTNFPTVFNAHLTDDDRFLLVYNFTPAQSVTVVDVKSRRFLHEIETPGCALVYPSGPRRFHMLCGDGSLLTVSLDEEGRARGKARSRPFFDPDTDPIQEDGVRMGDQWLFVSYGSLVYSVDAGGDDTPRFAEPWPLVGEAERAAGWRTGGMQLLAGHEASRTLYVAMHQGDEHSQDDPGTEIWVYDLAKRKRIRRIVTERPVSSLQVTRDDAPLLFTVFAGSPSLDVYDARSGQYLRTVEPLGSTPMILQTPWAPP